MIRELFTEKGGGLLGRVLTALLAGLVVAIFLPLVIDALRTEFRPIVFYFLLVSVSPFVAFLAWKRSLVPLAACLYLIPCIPLGGIIPIYAPVAVVLVAAVVGSTVFGRRRAAR